MVVREQFQKQLEDLNKAIINMAKLTENALKSSVDALYNQDVELADQVLENDKKIDRAEMEINDTAIIMIAKQQPVATDLRRLIIALRVVTDIERMGDNAKNIAKATIHLGKDYKATVPNEIKVMRDITLDMLQTSLRAFQYDDISVAQKLSDMDDKVDKIYKKVVTDLLNNTATNPDQIQYIMQIAFSARYIERFADHITNIGESILFLVKGENYNLNY
ncbi:phosphate signaling complex protein PhoU [Ornithinibacillus sp. L9]|uniref:Phosphate-specific transport system accessory protein PhoU n=1 Tax=Ornithinibacillus caprae TaxID=2678566 RepID=A0A6N8FGD7_9BACI|nr:phosphate signaling complex protein PhoU [Ornithinibacillus caprae]MUK87117.1 phosphate signaling complex protein PhoU [Ornithinibacillus caprae]